VSIVTGLLASVWACEGEDNIKLSANITRILSIGMRGVGYIRSLCFLYILCLIA
jgi:hypothetical protein